MTTVRKPLTYPSPKYGPTPEYGSCELDGESRARATCSRCGGHFCLTHVDHDAHATQARR